MTVVGGFLTLMLKDNAVLPMREMEQTNTGYTIQSTVPSRPALYWNLDTSGAVNTTITPLGRQWSVRGGVLFYGGRQVFYNVRSGRFTTTPPVAGTDGVSDPYSSAVSIRETTGDNTNWIATIVTVYGLSNPSGSGKALFSISTQGERRAYDLPVFIEPASGGNYPVLGVNVNLPTPLLTTVNQVQRRVGTQVINIPLSGFVPQPDLGQVVEGTTATATAQSNTGTGTSSWIWYLILIVVTIIILGSSLWLVTRKKYVTRPITEEPLFQAAMLSR